MGRGFSRIPRIYMEQPSRNQKISPQKTRSHEDSHGQERRASLSSSCLGGKGCAKEGHAEPAAEGAGADIRPKGRVNGGASQVAQQATVRQEGGAQRPNGREIHLLAYGIGSRTLRFLAKRRRRSTTTFRERALRRLFSTGRMPTSSRPITALMRATAS